MRAMLSTNMAAPVLAVTRALKAGRWLPRPTSRTPAVGQCLQFHVSPSSSRCSARTEPQKSDAERKTVEEEEEDEGPEYIPRKKAKNPMMVIGYAWMIGLPSGIIGFLLAKREVDKNRLKQLKVRQRMRQSNEGEYEGSRYLHHTNNE